MKRKTHAPDKWAWVHIKLHICNKKIAVILKGIAAIFVSTYFYVFAPIHGLFNGVINILHTVGSIVPCAFLFQQIVDKPCGSKPCCRSPPSFRSFSTKKSGGISLEKYF